MISVSSSYWKTIKEWRNYNEPVIEDGMLDSFKQLATSTPFSLFPFIYISLSPKRIVSNYPKHVGWGK